MGIGVQLYLVCSVLWVFAWGIITETRSQHESPGHWRSESKTTEEKKVIRKQSRQTSLSLEFYHKLVVMGDFFWEQ